MDNTGGKPMNVISSLLNKFRVSYLVKKGLKIGHNVYIESTVSIDVGYCWLISIGDNCVLTNGVTVLAHDGSLYPFVQREKIGKVVIGKNSFIGANSVILPNVSIGENVIIGAGSVVAHDIPSNSVAVGVPAKVIKLTEAYLKENTAKLPLCTDCFLEDLSNEDKQAISLSLTRGKNSYMRRHRYKGTFNM